MDGAQHIIERCPFLREVAEREGPSFAKHIACRPAVPYARSAGPVLEEDISDLAATFQLFHGESGVIPLRRACLPQGDCLLGQPVTNAPLLASKKATQLSHKPDHSLLILCGTAGSGCPFGTAAKSAQPASTTFATAATPSAVRSQLSAQRPHQRPHPMAGTPMASLSLSFGLPVSRRCSMSASYPTVSSCPPIVCLVCNTPAAIAEVREDRRMPTASARTHARTLTFASLPQSGLGDWWRAQAQRKPSRPKPRKQRPASSQASSGADGTAQQARSNTPAAGRGGKLGGGKLRGGKFSSGKLRSGARFRGGKFGDSGLARQVKALLAAGVARELKCPAAIVSARAAVARLRPVRALRPQALPIKLLAIGAFTGAANLPSGASRVHVRKFSPEWFLAVHATIPFIAMLRKAVVMPKWAIAWTVACAVIGQVMGARMERMRLSGGPAPAAAAPATAVQVPVADAVQFPGAGSVSFSSGAFSVATGGGPAAAAATCGQAASVAGGAWRQSVLVPALR